MLEMALVVLTMDVRRAVLSVNESLSLLVVVELLLGEAKETLSV